MNDVPDPERTALKEWAVLVDAMARGDIVAMVRKGGIREQRAGFDVRHERFLLYPTFFHEKAREVAPRFRPMLAASHAARPPEGRIVLATLAEVVAVWRVAELAPLRAIEAQHGLDWDAVESRFNYKQRPGVQVVAVRVRQLRAAAEIPEARRYGGCVSWVELDADVNVAGSRAVLDEGTLAARVAALTEALGEPTSDR